MAKLAWSRDNRRLISLDSRFEVRVWDVERSTSLADLSLLVGGFYAENAAVALSDDGRQMAFASGGEKKAYALIRDLQTGKTLDEWSLPGGFESIACAEGSKFVLVREELDERKEQVQTVALELEAGRPLAPARLIRPIQPGDRRRFLHAGLTPDGRYYWWTGPREPTDARRIEVRQVATGQLVFEKSGLSSAAEPEALLSPDGRHLWVSNGEKIKQDYDLADTSPPAEHVLGRPMAFSPTSRWLVVQDVPDDLRLFPAVVLRRLDEEHAWLEIPFDVAGQIDVASFSENGRYLALGHINGQITVVDLPELQHEIAEFEKTLPK